MQSFGARMLIAKILLARIAFRKGRRSSDEEIEIWSAFMMKREWRDAGMQRLNERLAEIGLPPRTVPTMFELVDLAQDEDR